MPHDTARLIELQGGKDAFIKRLDYIFDNVSSFHAPTTVVTVLTWGLAWAFRGTLTQPTSLRSRSRSCTTMLIDQGRALSAHGRRSHETTTRPFMGYLEMMVCLQVTPPRAAQADAVDRFGSYGKLCRVLPPRDVPASWHTPDAHLISVLLAYTHTQSRLPENDDHKRDRV